jgi:hypothetical protein
MCLAINVLRFLNIVTNESLTNGANVVDPWLRADSRHGPKPIFPDVSWEALWRKDGECGLPSLGGYATMREQPLCTPMMPIDSSQLTR